MSIFPPPVPSTQPTTQAGYTLAALAARLADIEQAISALQLHLASPQSFRIGQLEDVAQGGILLATGQDIRISDGHAPTFDRTSGLHVPRPVLAELTFHWRTSDGDLVEGVSDDHHSRWDADIIGHTIRTTTYSTPFTITAYVNGAPIQSCPVTSSLETFVLTAVPIIPTDTVTVDATSPGTGNKGVIVHCLLG